MAQSTKMGCGFWLLMAFLGLPFLGAVIQAWPVTLPILVICLLGRVVEWAVGGSPEIRLPRRTKRKQRRLVENWPAAGERQEPQASRIESWHIIVILGVIGMVLAALVPYLIYR